ncbi:tetratricopeptide repeat protein [Microcoleus sp. LEGE 07076]|uniref:tetratricopeptide repeat protein n=1 Tax=Microcoleus sp. LEGE 07076 TaxID=915322 RepID=UPI0030DB5EEE
MVIIKTLIYRAGQTPEQKAELFFLQGVLYESAQEYTEAIACYDKALEIKPDLHEAWHNRGVALVNLGRLSEALASYDKALEIKPDLHEAWHNRGYILNDLGWHEDAIASYDKALIGICLWVRAGL